MQLASEHVLDLLAAFALPCSPGAAACLVSNAAADAPRQQRPMLGRESAILQSPGPGTGRWSSKGSLYASTEDAPVVTHGRWVLDCCEAALHIGLLEIGA